MERPAFVRFDAMSTISSAGKSTPLIIEPQTGWASLRLGEIWRFRDLLRSFAARDVKLRYKQTALGVTWVVLQPLLSAAVFAFVFGLLARFKAPGNVPYFLFALIGMTAWTAFSGTLTRSTHSMVNNAHVVAKVYFPRMVLPLSSVFSTLIDLAVGLMMFALLLVLFWRWPAVSVLLAPLCLILIVAIAVGAGLWLSALAVSYRDVQYILPVLTQLLLYASPVAYPLAEVRKMVPARYFWLYLLNPLVAPLEALRFAVFGVGDLLWPQLAYSAGVAVVLLVAGALTFERMERKFADVI